MTAYQKKTTWNEVVSGVRTKPRRSGPLQLERLRPKTVYNIESRVFATTTTAAAAAVATDDNNKQSLHDNNNNNDNEFYVVHFSNERMRHAL